MPTKTKTKSAELEALLEQRNKLLQTKNELGESWTPEQQSEFDGLNEALRLLGYTEEQIEELTKEQPKEQPTPAEAKKKPAKDFEPSAREKNKVILKIRRGTKFDPNTGKPLGTPYVQSFSYGEWLNFSKNYSKLGYAVLEVIYDPYGQATKMFTK